MGVGADEKTKTDGVKEKKTPEACGQCKACSVSLRTT